MKILSCLLLVGFVSGCEDASDHMVAPEKLYNSGAFPVITSLYNNRYQTISVLYGNSYARSGLINEVHVPGEEYRMVTWKQNGNHLWFGGNIVGSLKAIEAISITRSSNGTVTIHYSLLTGTLQDICSTRSEEERTEFILKQRPSPLP